MHVVERRRTMRCQRNRTHTCVNLFTMRGTQKRTSGGWQAETVIQIAFLLSTRTTTFSKSLIYRFLLRYYKISRSRGH